MENPAPEISNADRRRAERPQVRLILKIARNDETCDAETEDLTLGGTRVRAYCEPPLHIGERVQVRFELPQLRAPVEVEAEVRWVNQMDTRCAGLQFVTGFRAIETWALTRLIAEADSSGG